MRLLDTDVCIEILRGNARPLARRSESEDQVATTWVTACELYYGAAKSSAPATNRVVVTDFLATLPVIAHDLVAAQWFGLLKARLEQEGARLADADLFIAAVALSRGSVLVTGNLRHFRRIPELQIEDWLRP